MPKVLFITQKVDKDDDLLGVYHKWIAELAKRVEKISVICLYKGKYELPDNVEVYSLGKETKPSRFRYLWRFYRYIWKLRKDYDVIFVHMNPEYLILGGLFWKIFGKKIILWYAHYLASLKLRLASFWADKIVTSARLAYPFKSRKLKVLQQGIDTERFKRLEANFIDPGFRILSLGRIAPIKDLEILLGAFSLVRQNNKAVSLTIVGSPTPGQGVEKNYFEKIKKSAADLNLGKAVEFRPGVPNHQTPAIYGQHDVFINLTATGSFDKSILEAMACELPVIVSNRAFSEIFPDDLKSKLMFEEKNVFQLAGKILNLINLGKPERKEIGYRMRALIVEKHNLTRLMDRFAEIIKSL